MTFVHTQDYAYLVVGAVPPTRTSPGVVLIDDPHCMRSAVGMGHPQESALCWSSPARLARVSRDNMVWFVAPRHVVPADASRKYARSFYDERVWRPAETIGGEMVMEFFEPVVRATSGGFNIPGSDN